jgi:hypothetical protein
LDEEECEVRIVAHDRRAESFDNWVVRWAEAVDNEFWFDVGCELVMEERIPHTKASISSSIMEWIRRCILLCLVPSNRYSGSERRVDRYADQDRGRKICTCTRLLFTTPVVSAFMPSLMIFPVTWSFENRRSSITELSLETLK